MTPIILRDTPLPTQKVEIFSTAVDGQSNIEIHVLRANQKFTHENISLGTFRLGGIRPAPKGIPQIEVTFTVNIDGFLFFLLET
ncbi:chaperone protein DnaK (plasmid) [Leptolyngbya boryana NIES-2135]|jgi:molecular chaperone DnaK|uniref:Chaperone protein DnaK n=1 Tax=Leptolyngbya boryana NIES-2135 TaxID=1973484 RepID=A0A1Z4JRG9_LEPBY|nr:Hsp70 family protein [Leptolyngbya sp. FACHB-238]MBD2397365.1 Hsp70 family protein [Leptolyngbya sp. FACHB-239]MBD2403830.1 Hsp70 family protein [Leptolyngbya sp. FACHB-402]BAY59294.1 chaperone protein DnaK [Leptolyngbya boryana NIES-2135]